MPNITDLPQDVLDIIFEHLQPRSLLSASLTVRSWSHVYKRCCCKDFCLDFSSDTLQDKIALLGCWEKLGLLGSVHQVSIVGGSDHEQDEPDPLELFFKNWVPKLSGLKVVTLDPSPHLSGSKPPILAAGVWLDLICGGEAPAKATASVLSAVQAYDGLRSLAVEFCKGDEATLSGSLKGTLLNCKNLRNLKVHVTSFPAEPDSDATQTNSTNNSILSWSPEEARHLPALQALDLYYPPAENAFKIWAGHGDWTTLQSLTAHHSWTLEHLTGRLPVLESLSVSTFDSLPRFLDHQNGLCSFAVANMTTSDTEEVTSSLRSILQQPFAATLNNLDLRMTKVNEEEQQPTMDVGMIAACCPQLQSVTVALDRGQYTNAVGYFCWIDACIEAIVFMPRLLRLCVILPRLILSGSISIPSEFITMDTVSEIRSKLAFHGKHMQEVRMVALMDEEIAQSERETAVLQYLTSEKSALTFIAAPAAKDWDAERGFQTVSCPELERAEALLSAGNTSRLHPMGDYSLARRTIDDISTFAHVGTIVPKRKPRPMPVWLTPWQEQDRREGPPGAARRAKRAMITSMDGFFGTWRLPMAERARTAAEKEARETGIGGRPGWSKSSLATRMIWSR